MSARPMLLMTVFDVREVDVDDPVLRDEVADALDGLVEHLVGLAERVDEGKVFVAERRASGSES